MCLQLSLKDREMSVITPYGRLYTTLSSPDYLWIDFSSSTWHLTTSWLLSSPVIEYNLDGCLSWPIEFIAFVLLQIARVKSGDFARDELC